MTCLIVLRKLVWAARLLPRASVDEALDPLILFPGGPCGFKLKQPVLKKSNGPKLKQWTKN